MKHVVITGSSRGLGLCMAREFLASGCTVTVSGRAGGSLESARVALEEFGDLVDFVPCDVRSREELETLWERAVRRCGRVDVWINNAGRNTPHVAVWNTGEEYLDAVLDTNIKGMIMGSQIAARQMLAQGEGQIWNMEGLGSNGMIQKKTVLYGTSKSALTYFTRGLAAELADTPVTAGRLSPGMMLTDFITLDADGEPSEMLKDERFKRIFNILGDRPEPVAAFLVRGILSSEKNDAHIRWLTPAKSAWRFASAPFSKRTLI